MKIYIGSDHRGFGFKQGLIHWLKQWHDIKDLGTNSLESVDYPDFAHEVAKYVSHYPNETRGIVICGSGNGVAISCNRHPGIRAYLCWNERIAELGREHGNANVLALSADFVDWNTTQKIVHAFLTTSFNYDRHQKRVEKIESN